MTTEAKLNNPATLGGINLLGAFGLPPSLAVRHNFYFEGERSPFQSLHHTFLKLHYP